jgi:hypothetical protein
LYSSRSSSAAGQYGPYQNENQKDQSVKDEAQRGLQPF